MSLNFKHLDIRRESILFEFSSNPVEMAKEIEALRRRLCEVGAATMDATGRSFKLREGQYRNDWTD